MIAAAALVWFVVAASTLGPRILDQGSRAAASPRWAIAGWQALSLSVVGAVLMALLALAAPLLTPDEASSGPLSPTWEAVQHHYGAPGGKAVAWTGLALALVLGTRLLVSLLRTLVDAWRRRRAQLAMLTLVGSEHPGGFHLLHSDTPTIYCLPGRRPRVVVTTAARNLLDDDELDLVLAHEHAHLRARHDLVIALSAALTRALPLQVLARAHDRLIFLVEMQADDAANSQDQRDLMARALLRLAIAGAETAPLPRDALAAPALAASECDAIQRVRRLTADRVPWRVRHSLLSAAAALVVLAMPVGLALAPAVGATTIGCCEAREF